MKLPVSLLDRDTLGLFWVTAQPSPWYIVDGDGSEEQSFVIFDRPAYHEERPKILGIDMLRDAATVHVQATEYTAAVLDFNSPKIGFANGLFTVAVNDNSILSEAAGQLVDSRVYIDLYDQPLLVIRVLQKILTAHKEYQHKRLTAWLNSWREEYGEFTIKRRGQQHTDDQPLKVSWTNVAGLPILNLSSDSYYSR